MNKNWLIIAWTLSLIATLGSLFLSSALHWQPCVLCWYQRIMMFPLVVVLGFGILKNIRGVEYIAWTLAGIGLTISLYHNLLMYRVIPENLSPCLTGVSCFTPYYFFYSFVTIPLLTFITFAGIIVSLIIYRRQANE